MFNQLLFFSAFIPIVFAQVIGSWDLLNLFEQYKAAKPNIITPYQIIQATTAWEKIKTANSSLNGVTIGIIDTGVDSGHQEFNNPKISFGNSPPDALTDTFTDEYPHGHGTQVAGIIGANNVSAIASYLSPQMNGIIGGALSPDFYTLEVRRFESFIKTDKSFLGYENVTTIGKLSEVLMGMKADVINMSIGWLKCSTFLELPLPRPFLGCVKDKYFSDVTNFFKEGLQSQPDTLFVISAGNKNTDSQNSTPANIKLDNTFVIGATGLNDERADFGFWFIGGKSNYGFGVDLSAPGIGVYAPSIRSKGNFPQSGGDYVTDFSGTSASAPFVTGVAAILKSLENEYKNHKPDLVMDPKTIKYILRRSADPIRTDQPLGSGCFDPNNNPEQYNGCRLNAYRAVAWYFPPASSTLSYSDLTSTSAKISWTRNNDPDFASYELHQIISLQPLVTKLIASSTDPDFTSYTVAGLTPNTFYQYGLRTLDKAGLFTESSNLAVFTTPALSAFLVPFANIVVDGQGSDWQGIAPAFQDTIGDKTGSYSGTDLVNIYLARNETYFYVKMDLGDGAPNTSASDQIYYSVSLNRAPQNQIDDLYLRSQFFGSEAFLSVLRKRTSISPPQAMTIAKDIARPGPNFLEMRIPLYYLPEIVYFYSRTATGDAIRTWDYTSQILINIPGPRPPAPPVIPSLTWKASPPMVDCQGPHDSQGNYWFQTAFNDAEWQTIALPDFNTWNCDNCDRYYRGYLDLPTDFGKITASFASDDGLWLYVNGVLINNWGAACHQFGCVNNPYRCGTNVMVDPLDITSYLHPGLNLIAVHVSDAGWDEIFNFSLVNPLTQMTNMPLPLDTNQFIPSPTP